jgi:hypothetical protein
MTKITALTLSGLLAAASLTAGAQPGPVTATTTDGRVIIVNPDGTWKLSAAGPELVKGKVNLVMGRAEDSYGSCRVGLRLENLTANFFQDYAPQVIMVDRDGNKLGEALWGSAGENLRPNGVATVDSRASNIPCKDVAQLVVSGWRYCKFQERRDTSVCESALNVVPSRTIPLVKR